jgi:DNA primase
MIPGLHRERTAPLNLGAIKRSHPIPDVAAAAGMKLIRAGNEYKACCPFHPDRSPSFTIYSGGMRWKCFGCGAHGDVFDFLAKMHDLDLRGAAAMLSGGNVPSVHISPLPVDDGVDRIAEAKAVWQASSPAQGTLAESYLRSRGLHLALPDSIRFTSLRYGKFGPEYPVLVAAVASADDKLAGIQRTYLARDGRGKASVPKTKLSLGRVSGGAIRLAACARHMVVCEGLEDGLTLQQELGRAVWVAAGATMLPNMAFPLGVETVAIGGDADSPGRAAAMKAAKAFAGRGMKASVFFPVGNAKDFNQALMEAAAW